MGTKKVRPKPKAKLGERRRVKYPLPSVQRVRVARRNPEGAWHALQKADAGLGQAREQFYSGKLTGRALLGKAMRSALAKRSVLERLALDPKFNILNDAAFNEKLFAFLRDKKAKKPFSFAILDLDFLRQLNKRSYAEADKAIALFVEFVRGISEKRRGFAGRFGGDELKLIVPSEASVLARDLDAVNAELNRFRLSFSGGVCGSGKAKSPSLKKTVEALNHHANEALKRSKAQGRNRVTVFKIKK